MTPEHVNQIDLNDECNQSPGSLVSSGSSAQTPDSGNLGRDPGCTISNQISIQDPSNDDDFLAVMQFLRDLVPAKPPYVPPKPIQQPSKVAISPVKSFGCSHCTSRFPSSRSLERHLESNHRIITCDFDGCFSTFRARRDATRHKNSVHSGKKIRSRCDRGFSRRDLVLRHERTCPSCATPPILVDNADLNQEEEQEEEDEWTNYAEYCLAQPYG